MVPGTSLEALKGDTSLTGNRNRIFRLSTPQLSYYTD